MFNDEPIGPDLSHPDAMIRLVSAVHRFQCPEMLQARKINYPKSFSSAAIHPSTKELMTKANDYRTLLAETIVNSRRSKTTPQKSVIQSSQQYLPYLHCILLSCMMQSDQAKLNKKLVFEWASGMEQTKKSYSSEALMYELVMTIACEGIATAGNACDDSLDGKFPMATQGFTKAAGIFQCLAEDQLPKWISHGTNVEAADLPCEVSVPMCDAFRMFYLAVAQQMAIATVLMKPGVPNYSLLAKLCKGVEELMESFVVTMRSKASDKMGKLDDSFLTLVTMQMTLQYCLSMYFLARSVWDKGEEYGLAIAMMNDAIQTMRTRTSITSKGMPEISKKSPLKALEPDLNACRVHLQQVLEAWEKDNSRVYFDKVPTKIPESRKIAKGVVMMKAQEYKLEEVDPLPLGDPNDTATAGAGAGDSGGPPSYEKATSQTNVFANMDEDEALARELQEKLNRGEID